MDIKNITILSYSRSGSNLLAVSIANALDAHLNLEVPLPFILKNKIQNGRTSNKLLIKTISKLPAKQKAQFNLFRIAEHKTESIATAFHGSPLNKDIKSDILVEKFTKHSILCDLLPKDPTRKTIILVRNPVDVIDRRISRGLAANPSVAYQAKLWDLTYARLWDYLLLHPDTLLLKFEDLIQGNDHKKIAEYIGSDADSFSFEGERHNEIADIIEKAEGKQGKHEGLKGKSNSQMQLSEHDQGIVQSICGKTMSRFGYDVSTQSYLSDNDIAQAKMAIKHREGKFRRFFNLPVSLINFLRKSD